MRTAVYSIFTSLLLSFLFSCCAIAQCADSFTSQTFQCENGEGCSDEVTVYYPNGDEYGVYVQCEGSTAAASCLPRATAMGIASQPH